MDSSTNKEKPRSAQAWRIDHRQLLPGDIFLEAGDTLFGQAIRAVDGGDFSHALMWVGNTDFIETVRRGARVISFARMIITDPEKWLWLRYPDEGIARAAATNARNLAHKRYSFPKALATKVRLPPATSPTSLFCSHLVAEAYARAGVALVSGKPAVKVTPNDLLGTATLQSLGRPPVISADLEPEDLVLLNRDKAYKRSLPAREQEIAQQAYAAVRQMTRGLSPRPGNLAETLQALADSPGDHSALADSLHQELETRGYFTLLDGLMFEIATGVAKSATSEEVAGWRGSAQRHQEQFQAYSAIAKHSTYAIWPRHARFHARNAMLFGALIEGAEGRSEAD
jgi:hypothetical protein